MIAFISMIAIITMIAIATTSSYHYHDNGSKPTMVIIMEANKKRTMEANRN